MSLKQQSFVKKCIAAKMGEGRMKESGADTDWGRVATRVGHGVDSGLTDYWGQVTFSRVL